MQGRSCSWVVRTRSNCSTSRGVLRCRNAKRDAICMNTTDKAAQEFPTRQPRQRQPRHARQPRQPSCGNGQGDKGTARSTRQRQTHSHPLPVPLPLPLPLPLPSTASNHPAAKSEELLECCTVDNESPQYCPGVVIVLSRQNKNGNTNSDGDSDGDSRAAAGRPGRSALQERGRLAVVRATYFNGQGQIRLFVIWLEGKHMDGRCRFGEMEMRSFGASDVLDVCPFKVPIAWRYRNFHRQHAVTTFVQRQKQQAVNTMRAHTSAAAKARTRLLFSNAGTKTNMPSLDAMGCLKRQMRTRQPSCHFKDFLCFT